MSRLGAGTTERLQDSFTITMDATTVALHEAAIAEALGSAELPSQALPARWRMRIPALVAAAMVVAPVGAAVASDNANPGDVLYPLKRIVEPFVSIFDTDVVASHRIEELVYVVDQPSEVERIPAAVSDAREAVSDLPPDHALRNELDVITDRVADHRLVDIPASDVIVDPPKGQTPGDDKPDVVAPTDDRPRDGAETTTPQPEVGEHPTTTRGTEERPPPDEPPATELSGAHVNGDDHPRHDEDSGEGRNRDGG